MISGSKTMTCTGNHACSMKSVTFSFMLLLSVVQSFNIHGLCNGQLCSFSVHVVARKVVRELLP